MQPSSVIFIVLIAVWAAYFALYWLRRREHLATAQTADQLSSAMRVLDRRSPVGRVDPTPRSYAANPTRALPGRLEADVDLRRDPYRLVGLPAVAWPVSVAPMRPGRRVRGLTLLTGLVGVVVAVLAAAVGVLPWPAVTAPLALTVAGFVWLRAGVQAQIRAKRLAAHAARPDRVQAGIAPSVRPAETSAAEDVDPTSETEDVEATVEVVPEPEPRPVRPLVDEDDIPLTWDPVPVPRPTYAMKAKAQRPSPTPAETTPAPEPVILEETAYADQERRVAGA